MLCGPSAISTNVRSAIICSSRSRAAVAFERQDAIRGPVDDQRVGVDEYDRPTGSLIPVVDVDLGAVLGPDPHERHFILL
jgi:hypothetical protein